jgi:hypothetical protein
MGACCNTNDKVQTDMEVPGKLGQGHYNDQTYGQGAQMGQTSNSRTVDMFK